MLAPNSNCMQLQMVQADVGKRHAIEDEEGAPVINVAQWHRARKALGCFGYGETQGAHGFSLSNVQAYALRHLSKRACLNWIAINACKHHEWLSSSLLSILHFSQKWSWHVLMFEDVWRCLILKDSHAIVPYLSMSFRWFAHVFSAECRSRTCPTFWMPMRPKKPSAKCSP